MEKVSMIIKSNLNDILMEMGTEMSSDAVSLVEYRLNFVRYLVSMYPDTSVTIDLEKVLQKFVSTTIQSNYA
jgi:hypothetical protein